MDLGLRGKKAILTGAAAGVGRAVAEFLAAEGADIGLCAADSVDAALAAVRATGVNVIGATVDVRDGEKYRLWLGQTVAGLGGCDIFIVNTSLDAQKDPDHSWSGDFETDVLQTIRGCETMMPHLKAAGGGAIVIIGASSTDADPKLAAYSAMQSGLVTYSKQLSQFLGRDGTRVNLVAPAPASGSPEEIARTVAFLASPAASLVTGACIVPGVIR